MNSKYFYHFMAKFYDILEVTYFSNYSKSPRKAVFSKIGEKENVLDICTGTGTNAMKIAKGKTATQVTGIDLSTDMLRFAREKAMKAQITNIKLESMDATKLSFSNATFDKILISLVLHEIEEPIADKIMVEATRVLKEDGEIIITEWEPSQKFIKRLLFLPVQLLEPKVYYTFIKKDLSQYFEKMNLQIKEIVHCNYTKVLILQKKPQKM